MNSETPKKKPTRRPVTIPQKTKTDIKPDLPEITPEDTATTPDMTEELPISAEDKQALEEMIVPETDAEWESAIASAKAAKAETTVNTTQENTEDAIEAEVQRRLQQRIQQQMAEADAGNPLLTKEEQAAAKEEATNTKSKEELEAEIAIKNNGSHLIYMTLGDDEDFAKAFEKEIEEDSRPDSEKTSDPTPYAAGLAIARQIGQKNNQQKLMQRMIGDLIKQNENILKEVGELARAIKISRVTPKIGNGEPGPKKLTGASAKAAVISRLKGMYRVHLYNSGFWVDLRKPTLLDIDSWMQDVDTDFKELGRVLGGHSHSVLDVYLKQKFMEILPTMVQRSNFEDWQDANALISNISFHDYDTLLWSFCCMMYKDGIGAGIYCTNPDCRYIDDNQYIDLRNICFINTELFNEKAIAWMQQGASSGSGMRTADDLKRYREEIIGVKRELSYDDGKTVYELQVPTIRTYIEDGMSLITKLTALVNGEKDITSEQVSNQLTFHLYKMLTPWVKSLKIYDDDKNLIYDIDDRPAIYESLDVEHFENSDLYKEITNYFRDTKISFYSSTTLKCPKCGKRASLEKDNMTALDMEYLFFCLSCLLLEQTGAQL